MKKILYKDIWIEIENNNVQIKFRDNDDRISILQLPKEVAVKLGSDIMYASAKVYFKYWNKGKELGEK